jgi:tetratricopeptide (TPR) repeat protein
VASGAAATAPAARASQKEAQEALKQANRATKKVEKTETIEIYVLGPVAILVAILAAGGVLGIVYSFRDQRRTSQLHELAVTGEAASQRRAEQSYGSFLEQSQTTLALVNDTLKLAKEATDQAAHGMEEKAETRVAAIERRAQALMLEIFEVGVFESIIADHDYRTRLHSIADELRSLEGYLSLQDIELPQYTTFIKAIDQFLLDETESALQALRLAVQNRAVGDLQRFTEYWLGYVLTTIGHYEEALGMLRREDNDMREHEAQHFQLERIIKETEFFVIAKARARREQDEAAQRAAARSDETTGSEEEEPSIHDRDGPLERYDLVSGILDDLEKLAENEKASPDKRGHVETAHEIARTRADIFEWVAYHPDHLDDALIARDDPDFDAGTDEDQEAPVSPVQARRELEGHEFRAWALKEARAICLEQSRGVFDVDFALAECRFKLGQREAAQSAFAEAESGARHALVEFREKRQKASLQESLLICHSRLCLPGQRMRWESSVTLASLSSVSSSDATSRRPSSAGSSRTSSTRTISPGNAREHRAHLPPASAPGPWSAIPAEMATQAHDLDPRMALASRLHKTGRISRR